MAPMSVPNGSRVIFFQKVNNLIIGSDNYFTALIAQ